MDQQRQIPLLFIKFVGAWPSAYEIKSPGGALDITRSVDSFEHDGNVGQL